MSLSLTVSRLPPGNKPRAAIRGPDDQHEALWAVVDIRPRRPVQHVLQRWPEHGQATPRRRLVQAHVEMQARATMR
eukprot:4541501-Alexandrium_andersonii.AAC.1